MIVFTTRSKKSGEPTGYTLTLAFDQRQKSRMRVTLDGGQEAFLKLDRGPVLRAGDVLETDDGMRVQVVAAAEALSVVRSNQVLALTRAAYHLGNRHVPLQIREGELSYLQDRVLDFMVASLGFEVSHQQGPFEPEAGAYGHGGAGHASAGHATAGHGVFRHTPHSHD